MQTKGYHSASQVQLACKMLISKSMQKSSFAQYNLLILKAFNCAKTGFVKKGFFIV